MTDLISKLRNMFTAMALADAGDFDGVKDILRENAEDRDSAQTNAPPARPCDMIDAAGLAK